ncbi:hypothetical protein EVD19_12480 [Elizabethkingia meningoseptica]|nr:hypothetical protein EVD19_12480 [Elizabethkingia meningoseptica]
MKKIDRKNLSKIQGGNNVVGSGQAYCLINGKLRAWGGGCDSKCPDGMTPFAMLAMINRKFKRTCGSVFFNNINRY